MKRSCLHLKPRQWVPPPGGCGGMWSYSPLLSSPGDTHTSARCCTPTAGRQNTEYRGSEAVPTPHPHPPRHGRACTDPVSRTDGLDRGPGAGAEVELLDGEAFVVETDVVRPAGRPVLHVPQVGVSVDQHVGAAEQKRQSETAAAAQSRTRALRQQRTCSPETRCGEPPRKTSVLPGALRVGGRVRCWSTAGTRSGRP